MKVHSLRSLLYSLKKWVNGLNGRTHLSHHHNLSSTVGRVTNLLAILPVLS